MYLRDNISLCEKLLPAVGLLVDTGGAKLYAKYEKSKLNTEEDTATKMNIVDPGATTSLLLTAATKSKYS